MKKKEKKEKNENIESNEETVKNENTKTKIGFFKKAFYSIAKVSKYDEMTEEGLGSAITYFFQLIAIMCLIIGLVAAYIQMQSIDETKSYLEGIIPELEVVDGKLSLEKEEVTILDEEESMKKTGSAVVVNPYLKSEEAIDEYYKLTTEEYNCIIFLGDEVVVIPAGYTVESDAKGDETSDAENNANTDADNATENEEKNATESKEESATESKEENSKEENSIVEYAYSDIIAQYGKDGTTNCSKGELISYLCGGSATYMFYVAVYFISYLIILLLFSIFYTLIISLSLFLIFKILKMSENYKTSVIITLYSSTLAMIVFVAYMLISYFTKFSIPYYNMIAMFIVYVYLFLILTRKRKEQLKTN